MNRPRNVEEAKKPHLDQLPLVGCTYAGKQEWNIPHKRMRQSGTHTDTHGHTLRIRNVASALRILNQKYISGCPTKNATIYR